MLDSNIYAEALDRAGWSAEDGGTLMFQADEFPPVFIGDDNGAAEIANDILYTN